MIIYPNGLLEGDRLAACSDEAQLHFPRLVALANGFARMELNAKTIIETAYANFRVKPSREQLTGWLKEYAAAHLLFVYSDDAGTPWGQWCGIPDRMLPRFKTAVDKRSPTPPEDQFSAYEAQYAEKKKASGDFLSISEDFGNVPKSSEASETLPLGIGIGIGIGIGEKPPIALISAGGKKDAKTPKKQTPSDPRHTPIREYLECSLARVGVVFAWNASAAGALSTLLKGISDKPESFVRELIDSLMASDVRFHTEKLPQLIAGLLRFQRGPLDKHSQLIRVAPTTMPARRYAEADDAA